MKHKTDPMTPERTPEEILRKHFDPLNHGHWNPPTPQMMQAIYRAMEEYAALRSEQDRKENEQLRKEIEELKKENDMFTCYKDCGNTKPYKGICLNCGSSLKIKQSPHS